MRKETLFLDTSVPSAFFDKRVKERQTATIKFWKEVIPKYKVYVSAITVEEVESTKDKHQREKMKALIKDIPILKMNKKIRALAEKYIEEGIFPKKYIMDALQVGIASFYEIAYLISWNFEHLVKVKTRRMVNLVNNLEGYREIEIVPPPEI